MELPGDISSLRANVFKDYTWTIYYLYYFSYVNKYIFKSASLESNMQKVTLRDIWRKMYIKHQIKTRKEYIYSYRIQEKYENMLLIPFSSSIPSALHIRHLGFRVYFGLKYKTNFCMKHAGQTFLLIIY